MGLWSKMKGVFSRIGKGLRDILIKPSLAVTSAIGAPLGAAIGSIVPGIGTAAGASVGGIAQGLAAKLNQMMK